MDIDQIRIYCVIVNPWTPDVNSPDGLVLS